ncbi:GNAT family N-acetyltransferase [Micromonospora sp. NPDC049836]|uniref:GNAT family N-acetyltransferase n=1 Tax=unclassified Micromonospora TaxID=2617518 RepID=UPI0033F89891
MSDLMATVVGPDDWPRVERFFGPKGLTEHCFCQYFRLERKDYAACRSAARRDRLAELITTGERVGILGSIDEVPVGWIGVGPRLGFPRLRTSRAAKLLPGDDPARIWSIVCVYLAREQRHQGLLRVLINRAVQWARDEKADLIEAYPEDDRDPATRIDPRSFRGRVTTFEACGFAVVEPRLQHRALIRKDLR